MTLDDICLLAARYTGTYDDLEKTEGAYAGDALILFDTYKDEVNRAYMTVMKRYLTPQYSEDIVLDSDLKYTLSSLAKTINYPLFALDSSDVSYDMKIMDLRAELYLASGTSGATYTLTYTYIPDELSALLDVPLMTQIDAKIYAYYAASMYFAVRRKYDPRSLFWQHKWDEALSELKDESVGAVQVEESW